MCSCQSSFSLLRAFLDISAFLSYFKTLSSGPTLEIEPMAYCWFTLDVTAPNVGDQEQKCRSLLRTKKVLLITNVSTLSHDCKLSVRTSAQEARNSEKEINFTWFELARGLNQRGFELSRMDQLYTLLKVFFFHPFPPAELSGRQYHRFSLKKKFHKF